MHKQMIKQVLASRGMQTSTAGGHVVISQTRSHDTTLVVRLLLAEGTLATTRAVLCSGSSANPSRLLHCNRQWCQALPTQAGSASHGLTSPSNKVSGKPDCTPQCSTVRQQSLPAPALQS